MRRRADVTSVMVCACVSCAMAHETHAQTPLFQSEEEGRDEEARREEPEPDREARAGGDRPTVQRRFAAKERLGWAMATATTHVRDDFYDTWGIGVDAGYFTSERWGFEGRFVYLFTQLDDAALDLRERIGLTPDARPQKWWAMAGGRWAPGYGKMLMGERFLIHFDPQLALHLGLARAENRWIPTAITALSLLGHWRYGLKAKLDLGVTMQLEKRARGWVFSTGFAPVVGIGWGRNF